MIQFDFENDKRLRVKIDIEKRREKEIKVQKREKPNKEVTEITLEMENVIFKF